MEENGNVKVSPEGLSIKGKEITGCIATIKEALEDIETARQTLLGWVSQNKDRFDSKMAKSLPKMYEMIDAIESFGNVAINTSEKTISIEKKIEAGINDNIA